CVGAITASACNNPCATKAQYRSSQAEGTRPAGRQARAQLNTSLWAITIRGIFDGEHRNKIGCSRTNRRQTRVLHLAVEIPLLRRLVRYSASIQEAAQKR